MNNSLDLRLLSGAMAKVILLLEHHPQGLTLREISCLCGVRDLGYLRKDCHALQEMGLLEVACYEAHGRAVWLLVNLEGGEKPSSEAVSGGEKPPARGEKPSSENRSRGQKPPSEDPSGGEKSPGGGEKPPSEESLKDLRLKDSVSKTLSCESQAVCDEGSKRFWLEQAVLLFGKPVTWHASFAQKEAGELLGWLAQAHEAWRNRQSSRPWGLVYKGLRGEMASKQPDRRFREDPLAWLPEEYLKVCGLEAAAPPPDPQPEEDEQDPEESDPLGLLPPEQARIARAWQSLLGLLEEEMPRGMFEGWVSDTRVLDWDENEGLLRVLARDAPAVEWLESRIQSLAGRLLCGILNCAVQVQFVCETGRDT